MEVLKSFDHNYIFHCLFKKEIMTELVSKNFFYARDYFSNSMIIFLRKYIYSSKDILLGKKARLKA